MKSKLALDLGTTTGFAIGGKGHVASGIWQLKPKRHEGGGMRYLKFRRELAKLYSITPFDEVWYEEIRRHAGTTAAHVYGGLQAEITAFCEERGIPYASVPVGTIKKHWTGNGAASKDMMIDEARRRGFSPITDDEADALALHHLKMEEIEEVGEKSHEQKVEERRRELETA